MLVLQNLGEAEYLVTIYQYMRLRGYPAEKISVLTTYNGQKALLRDVIERRCAGHPAFGRPLKVPLLPYFPLSSLLGRYKVCVTSSSIAQAIWPLEEPLKASL